MSTLHLFPTHLKTEKWKGARVSELNRALVRECRIFRDMDSAGRKWSGKNYPGGYTSYSSITDLAYRSSNFEKLRTWIDTQAKAFARELELDLGTGRLEMTSFWINIMGARCQHSFHLHPLSTLSGTYYLQVPRGSGGFKIEDPRLPAFMASPPRRSPAKLENRRFYDFSPEAGSLVLFESWLKHEVTPNQAKAQGPAGDRISVSFNYDWVR